MEPCFITLEGLDGSGKSTHAKRIEQWLAQAELPYVSTQEPGGTPLGEAIRKVFLDRQWGALDGAVEAMMVFASRRQHLLEVIEPALAAGNHVLCDRFTDSTFAYQGGGRGVSAEVLDKADELATGRKRPDLTLLFDLPAELARARGHSSDRRAEPGGIDRLDREELAFYQRVRAVYLDLAAESPERFVVIDSSGTIEQTENQLRTALGHLLGEAS